MSTQQQVDIATMVGKMEAPACESAGHSTQPEGHSDGPASMYVRVTCEPCGYTIVKAYCQGLSARIASGQIIVCPECSVTHDAVTILGPVKS